MKSLGHQTVGGVRVGKTVTFDIDGEDTPEMRAKIDQLCDGLLSNPVIEDYRFATSTRPARWALVGLMKMVRCSRS